MQFSPFKSVKKFTTTITTTTPDSALHTVSSDSLVFVNVYNTTSPFSYFENGYVYYDTNETTFSLYKRRLIWKGDVYSGATRLGQGGGGSYVDAGTQIRQNGIWGGGTIVIDVYVFELNESLVSAQG